MKKLLLLFLLLNFLNVSAQHYHMLVGTYDSQKSGGIYVYDFDSKNGIAKEISHVKTSNSSFLAVAKNNKFVYAVNENANKNGNGGSISSFSFNNKKGILLFINQQSSEGNHPCHTAIDNGGKWLSVSNYSTGNLSLLPIKKMER